MVFVGTAGWSVPARYADHVPKTGTHLERYGRCLNAAEINTSFYRPHQRKTYERWAASVPNDFRFSIKLPRSISHDHRLQDHRDLLARFLEEVSGLGEKLGVVLIQLPPTLAYDGNIAAAFFRDLRQHCKAPAACEPRHSSWFTPEADVALKRLHIARVAADPPRAPNDGEPGGWPDLRYWRLHGSPKIYYSGYEPERLEKLAKVLEPRDWCIFDNTAGFAALGDALTLKELTAA
jgi:uncharacterized protein YecE (DUF72 family)